MLVDARSNFGHADARKQISTSTALRLPVLLVGAVLLASGCIGIMAEGRLEKVESLPDISQFSAKPAVYLRTSKEPAGYYDAPKRVTEQSGLFRSVSFDIADQPQADYTIDMHGVWGKEGLGFFSFVMLAGCATPYGVPVPIADTSVTLNASVEDRSGKTLGSYKVEESLTIWCGLSLLPLAPFTITYDERLWESMIKVIYKKILDDGLFLYSP